MRLKENGIQTAGWTLNKATNEESLQYRKRKKTEIFWIRCSNANSNG